MSLVTYELDDHVATITLNRPEARNAINGPLRNDLNAAWERFRADEAAWVGILTANGEVFCAGADLTDSQGAVGTFAGTFWEKPTINSFESGLELFKPTIAAVHGPCIGYGLTGLLFCDFVIASTEAVFRFPEVSIGVPTIVGAIRLPQRVGWANVGAAAHRRTDHRTARLRDRAGVEAGRAAGAAGGRPGLGSHPDQGRSPGPTGHQRGGVAQHGYGLDRIGAIRRDHAQSGRCHRRRRGRTAGLAGETPAALARTLRNGMMSLPRRELEHLLAFGIHDINVSG